MSTLSDWSAKFEERIADEFRRGGFPGAERMRVKHPDRGDLLGIPDWTIECKSVAPRQGRTCESCKQPVGRFNMAAAMDQAAAARATNASPYSAVIRQRKNAPTGRTYVIVELSQFIPTARRLDES
jgi:hypothetical protein